MKQAIVAIVKQNTLEQLRNKRGLFIFFLHFTLFVTIVVDLKKKIWHAWHIAGRRINILENNIFSSVETHE